MFFNNKKKIEKIFFGIYLFALSLPYHAPAKDFLSSVENASDQIRQIIAVVGVLSLMIAGFVFTGQKGLEWKSFLPPL